MKVVLKVVVNMFSGNLDLYPISQLKSIKVSYEEDFKLAEKLINLGEN